MYTRLAIYIGYYLLNLFVVQDILTFFLTLPMMTLVAYNLTRFSAERIGVEDMLTFVIYLFFVIEPMQRVDHGHIGVDGPVSGITYNNYYLFTASAAVTLFYAVFTIALAPLVRRAPPPRYMKLDPRYAKLLLVFAFLSFAGYVILSGGIGNVLALRSDKDYEAGSVFGLVMLAGLTTAAFLLATMVRGRLTIHYLYLLLAWALLLVSANPYNAPRFWLLAVHGPMFLILLRGRISVSVFYTVLMAGVVVAMPVLSLTSRFGTTSIGSAPTEQSSIFALPFIDVYDMMVECVRFTDIYGHTYGAKLLADIAFFIPRSLWMSKPTLNGLDIGTPLAEDKIAGTSNLSMFVGGDAYRDFGYFGVVLVALLLAMALYYLTYRRPINFNRSPIIHYVLISSLPILIRGPISAVLPLFFLQVVWLSITGRFLAEEVKVALPRGSRRLVADRLAAPLERPLKADRQNLADGSGAGSRKIRRMGVARVARGRH